MMDEHTMVERTKEKEKHTTGVYSHDDVLTSSTKYFDGDILAATVWIDKYALRDSKNNLYELNPDAMHHRIASELARIDSKYQNPSSKKTYYDLLKNFKYIIPQGSPMAGIGNNFQLSSLSNCFVIGQEKPADSYGGIMQIDQEQVQLMKRRGGVGHDLSHLRPTNSPVKNSALTSTGIVSFMERYSNSSREVGQNGRRGALMLSIDVKHPDAEHFIDAKMNEDKVTGANISVRIGDDFMKAVVNGTPYKQQYPIDSSSPDIVKNIDARILWDKIIHNAWKSAEPGVLFWDTIISESIPDCYADYGFKTVSTNPCAEIPLCVNDSCRLLAINLYSYVKDAFKSTARFDFDLFKKHIIYAQKIMDNLIDLELEKIDSILRKIDADPEIDEVKHIEKNLWEKIRKKAIDGRRTGIGITAEGDMIAAMGMRYGSDDAIIFSEEVHKTLAIEAYRASMEMAKDRGSFAIFNADKEKRNPFLLRIKKADEQLYADIMNYGRRNISLLTIAPTGTTSMMTQTTSGIEPVFLPVYKRRRKITEKSSANGNNAFIDKVGDKWEEYVVFHHKFITWLKVNKYDVNKVKNMTDKEIAVILKKSPYYKSTANDIDWMKKLSMQGSIQKWVDHSISVTINLPKDTTEELVGQLYKKAWEEGCKGVTVYRDGSRTGVLVANNELVAVEDRPVMLDADVVRFKNVNEQWVTFVGLLNGQPYEIFTGKIDADILPIPASIKKGKITKIITDDGSTRYDFQYLDKQGYGVTFQGLSRMFDKEFWNYAKLISGILRHKMPIENVVELVTSMNIDGESINTWKNGVGRALRKYIPNGTKVNNGMCEDCGQAALVYQEGCMTCKSCGTSKCG